MYRLVQQAEHGDVDPQEGLRRLDQIRTMQPRFGAIVRTFGHDVLAMALALLVIPT